MAARGYLSDESGGDDSLSLRVSANTIIMETLRLSVACSHTATTIPEPSPTPEAKGNLSQIKLKNVDTTNAVDVSDRPASKHLIFAKRTHFPLVRGSRQSDLPLGIHSQVYDLPIRPNPSQSD